MRKNDGRAIPNFIFQALKNRPLTVYGSGSQTRSFCYVDDLVKGIIKTMNSNIHEPINLGNPNEMSVMHLAKTIIRLSNSKSKIIFKSLPEDDPKRRRPDITKAKKLLSWQPKVNLEVGLKETISWFKNNHR
jgi:nucleoside-diphosphate-sugar epimerase